MTEVTLSAPMTYWATFRSSLTGSWFLLAAVVVVVVVVAAAAAVECIHVDVALDVAVVVRGLFCRVGV